MSNVIHANIRFLRQRLKLTQAEAAARMGFSRSQLAGYESTINPTLEALVKLSDFFSISADHLLRTSLQGLSEKKLQELTFDPARHMSGSQLRVLATTVDAEEREYIEVVSEKARAGYASGYSDPEFIGDLPRFQLPFLSRQRKYRSFQLSGDSMLPIPSGAWVISEYLDDWNRLKDGTRCVVLTRSEGIVFKLVYRKPQDPLHLLMVSQNPEFAPYELPVSEILEIWIFKLVLSAQA